MNMKRKFWTISLLGAMVVTQTVPQVMVSAAQTRKNRVLLNDVSEVKSADKPEESMETILYDVNAEYAKKKECYIDRFIVKYAEKSKKRNVSGLTEAAEQAYAEAKIVKDKIEEEYEQKLMTVPDGLEHAEQSIGVIDEKYGRDPSEIGLTAVCEKETQYQVLQLPESVDPNLFLMELEGILQDEVMYIQPDYILELSGEAAILNDGKEEITAPKKPGEVSVEGDMQEMIPDKEDDLQRAWEISKGEGITVALIDTGVDITHPMLEKHIVDGYDFYNERETVYDENLGMEQAHGTHIAGIIAQTAPDAKILPLKVFENGRAYTSDIVRAIEYAEENGASIVNMSFGCTSYNEVLEEVMERSEMFFVCAAGNHRRNIDLDPIYPASYRSEERRVG